MPHVVRPTLPLNTKAYMVGGGIASLASAAYLIRDGGLTGNNICIFEEGSRLGGSLDGTGTPEHGYVIRGGRMFTYEAYSCTFDLLSFIPSLIDAGKTVKEEICAFNERHVSNSRARLLHSGQKLDTTALQLSNRHRLELIDIMATSEDALGAKRIRRDVRARVLQDELLVHVGDHLRVSTLAQRRRAQALPAPIYPGASALQHARRRAPHAL